MPGIDAVDGTPEGVFGAEVRFYRTRAGLSQAELAALVNVSHDVISKIETGARAPAGDFPPRLDDVSQLDTRESLTRLWGHLSKGARHRVHPGWFHPWTDREGLATALRTFEHVLVPGLVQTAEYARAVLSTRPNTSSEQVEELVAARLDRQVILDRDDPPLLWVVLDEAVLHRDVGGSKVMHDQLMRLAELAERPNITVEVVPYAAGAHSGLLGAFVIADFADAPGIVYLETAAGGRTMDDRAVLAEVSLVFDTLRSEALPRRGSHDMIVKIAEERWT